LKPLFALLTIVILGILLFVVGVDKALADSLQNAAYKQRIGNYDVEMTTDPKSPVVGSSTSILIRITGVNGDHLVDVPITIRIVKDGSEIQRTNPIIVPYGHYTHQFAFEQGGRYTIYVDINDYMYSGEILTFTFFTNVAGTFDYLYIAAPIAVAIAVAVVILLAFVKKNRNNKRKKAAEQS
jgi:hypothetical protein